MSEIYGQWVEPEDDEKRFYYFYHVKKDRFRFNHWSDSTTREYDPTSSQFKSRTKFKLILIF